ncbi:MAG: phosphopentomutase [Chloroflexi bacterium HGW-Chloroflexi-10]|nr:MAG: phosphopentomutase [Chloroflexi bacterium HGW-Chloroflexi-10]
MMQPIRRVIVFVLDGVGAGEAPDAAEYGDKGSNSLGNTAQAVGGLKLPNMEKLGFGYITQMEGVARPKEVSGAFGKLTPISKGKDSVTGHWELMGIYLREPFPVYPHGFPPEVLDEFTRRTGLEVLGNKPASGTAIIQELGEEHMRTGKPIVYTSGDSVFQIAAHEDIIPIERLYELCRISRELLSGQHAVGRVIARPFSGKKAGEFERTSRRHDYPRFPESDTMMMKLIKSGYQVYATGKIDDLFGNQGITTTNHTTNNLDSLKATLEFMKIDFEGLLFANLIEFDQIYGHRNDSRGYADALEAFDSFIPEIQAGLRTTDLVMVVADHGVDPTTESTDHSREYSPLLVFGAGVKGNTDLGVRGSYADVGATIAEIFQLESPEIGKSFLALI